MGTVIRSWDQASRLASGLKTAEEGDVFVRQCLKTPVGRDFLAGDEWRRIQAGLVARIGVEDQVATAGAEWDALVDAMVDLPTVKMAHEFLCRHQVTELGRAFLASPVWRRWARARFPELDPVSGQVGAAPQLPRVGDDVMYVSYGTPVGGYRREERTARVTSAGAWVDVEVTGSVIAQPGALRRVVQVWNPMACALTVFNPEGWFQPVRVEFHDGWVILHESEREAQASQLIGGRIYPGGTWHWPRPRTREPGIATAEQRLESERLEAGICPDHGKRCKTWVKTLSGGVHVGGPVG